ncbi:YeeE/YedE thiosulfate transporter family protein [Oryzisolibacter sp. LB2S]|uniref:YeeE/YedE thiosulfate transporter family protein n=1 Tax=Alicycliphilus soli TaxID=3228789 RepID=UPI00345796E1
MLLWAGFLMGCAFGVAARLGRFCLLRGLREAPALRAFALALAVALLASQALAWAGLADLGTAQVVRARFSLPGAFVGGLLFGAGMALARNCGARALVLLAGGNLRALVVLLCLGLAAQATLTGVLAPLRQWLQGWGMVQLEHAALPQWLAAQGLPPGAATLGAAALPALALAAYALRQVRGNGVALACAAVIGALVAALWWVTAQLADPFEPVPLTSLSFIGPVAEGLLYLQLAVGRTFNLGPAIVAGTLAGACVTALVTRTARWEGFDSPARLAASAGGGLLMGLGGVLAVGCSIGQGLSGLSTLAFASLPACAGIVAGALLVLSFLNRSPQGDLHATS